MRKGVIRILIDLDKKYDHLIPPMTMSLLSGVSAKLRSCGMRLCRVERRSN